MKIRKVVSGYGVYIGCFVGLHLSDLAWGGVTYAVEKLPARVMVEGAFIAAFWLIKQSKRPSSDRPMAD